MHVLKVLAVPKKIHLLGTGAVSRLLLRQIGQGDVSAGGQCYRVVCEFADRYIHREYVVSDVARQRAICVSKTS